MPLEQTTLPVGTLLRERYLLKNILGAGNSGTVYLIKDCSMRGAQNDLFALKEILGLSQQERHQFAFNGRYLQQLHHPALPSIHHIFNEDMHQRVYLVTDYVEGTDLDTLCQDAGHFAWCELQAPLAPVFEALAYLHNQQLPIIHGDIKPLNLIWRAATGTIVLVDLGYAQASAGPSAQFTTTVLSNFRAPERLAGELTTATDIYELGATLYLLLTGQAPIDAATRRQAVKKGEPDPLLPANEIVSTISQPFAAVLQRVLALDPAERFASVQAFWHELNAVSSSTPASLSQTQPGTIQSAVIWTDSPRPARDTPSPSVSPGRSASQPTFLLVATSVIAVLLLILVLSIWALIQSYIAISTPQASGHTTAVAGQPTLSVTRGTAPQVTPSAGKYPNISGVYQGVLAPLDAPPYPFSLTIQQQQSHLSGTFSSSRQNGTFTGTIDLAGNVQFIVFNASGDAIYAFTGGLNNITPGADTLGGSFSSCAPGLGATCQPGSGPSGPWNLTQATT